MIKLEIASDGVRMSKNKAVWEKLGETDPYFAVATHDEFRQANIDADARASFFESGKEHLEEVWAVLEDTAGTDVKPKLAVDYGCGVGRILLPLAERCKQVVGVDISGPMLEEAQRNAAAAGLTNVTLQTSDEFAADRTSCDFVHSFIVIQHIPPRIGYEIVSRLVERLAPGGYGMIHVVYKDKAGVFRRLRSRLYRDLPGFYRLASILRRRDTPLMPMYEYDLDRARTIFGANSCEILREVETDHGFLGKMLYIRKEKAKGE